MIQPSIALETPSIDRRKCLRYCVGNKTFAEGIALWKEGLKMSHCINLTWIGKCITKSDRSLKWIEESFSLKGIQVILFYGENFEIKDNSSPDKRERVLMSKKPSCSRVITKPATKQKYMLFLIRIASIWLLSDSVFMPTTAIDAGDEIRLSQSYPRPLINLSDALYHYHQPRDPKANSRNVSSYDQALNSTCKNELLFHIRKYSTLNWPRAKYPEDPWMGIRFNGDCDTNSSGSFIMKRTLLEFGSYLPSPTDS